MKKEWWIGTVIGTLISLLAVKFSLDGPQLIDSICQSGRVSSQIVK